MVDLKRMRYLSNRLPHERLMVERAMARATKCTASLSGMPGGGMVSSPVERGVEELEAARAKYNATKAELQAARDELSPLIEAMESPLQRNVMRMRYMDGHSVREIAYLLLYSEQHVFRVLDQAEKKILKR